MDSATVTRPACPFPGLRPFQRQEASLFFGRSREVSELRAALLGERRFLAVVGTSGCGKSSLVEAGLLPGLLSEQTPAGRRWREISLRPMGAPVAQLATSLATFARAEQPDSFGRLHAAMLTSRFRATLRQTTSGLVDAFREILTDPETPVLLVVDQFEELFRYEPDETEEDLPLFRDEAQAFANLLLEATRAAETNIYVLITMRSDFFGECGRYRGLAEAVSNSHFLVPRMVREQLQEAITRPLCVAADIPADHWSDRWPEVVEPALLQRLLNAVGDEATADPLPVMQHALMRAWQMAGSAQDQRERPTPQLRVVDYVNAGEIAEALSRHADEVLERSAAAAGAALPRHGIAHLFRALTDIDREGRAIRRPQTLAELAPVVGTDISTLMTVLDAFRGPGVSFLTPYMPASISEETPIDISHEALIRRWTRISDQSVDPTTGLPRGWVQQEFRDGLIWRALVLQAEEFGRNPQVCLDPGTLEERYPWFRALRRRPAWVLRYAIRPAGRTDPNTAPEWLQVRQLLLQSLRRKRDERRARRAEEMRRAEEARKEVAAKLARERDRRIRIAGISAIVTLLLAAFSAWTVLKANAERELASRTAEQVTQLLALQARRDVAEATSAGSIERGAALALASIARSTSPPDADAIQAAMSALSLLPLAVLSDGGGRVTSLVVLRGGRLASGGEDGKIKLWPNEGGGEPEVLPQGSPVFSLAVWADGRLASGDADGKIKIWPKESTREPVVLSHGGGPVWSLAVLTDGRLASGGDGTIKLWPKEGTGAPVTLAHGGRVVSLAVLADGRLASGGLDGKIKVWPMEGAGAPMVLSPGGRLYKLAALPDGRLASACGDGTIKIWPKDGIGAPLMLTHGSVPVLSLAALADGGLASGDFDGTIKLWPKEGTGEPVVLSQGSPVQSLAVLADGRLASGGDDGNIKIWAKEGTSEPVILWPGGRVWALAGLADGRLASGTDSAIKIWPREGTGEPVILPQHSPLWSLAGLADGRLASGDADGKISLWPKDFTGEPVVRSQDSRLGSFSSLAGLPDGRLASGGADGKISLWPEDFAGKPAVLIHGSQVTSLAGLADGRLASAGADGTIKLWPREGTGEPVVVSYGSPVHSLAGLADGRLASAGRDGTIIVWPREFKGAPVILSHSSQVTSLAGLADGRLASGGRDGTVKVWPKEGNREPVVLSQGSEVWSLAVLADGRLASGGEDGTIKLWLVDEKKLIAALCLRAGRNLSKAEWARYIGADTPWQPSCRDLPSNWRTPA
jgi:WD40 repeat protein